MSLPAIPPGATVVVCEDDAADARPALRPPRSPSASSRSPPPSAADALRLCHFKQPDLLLLDLNLPDASGLDVLREIRAQRGRDRSATTRVCR